MTPARWREVKELYFGALDQPVEQRSAWLAERCQDDAALRAEIEQLLANGDGSAAIDNPPARGFLASWATGPALRDGQLLGGRFEIVKHLGSGGMGDVYEAIDRDLGTHVAVKLIRGAVAGDPNALARFRREIALARQVTHRSVCRVFDFFPAGEHNDSDFLTMELLHGETLADKLRRDGPMTLDQALPLLRQIATGLDAAHSAGVLHRDLKGSNIFLVASSGGPRAVLMDFGLARSSAGNDTVSTGSAWAAGTPAYMSPEQLEGNELGPASDIYSLGVVMYEMATGRAPHEGHSPLQIAVRRLKESPRAPRELTPSIDSRWESAILKCLAQSPKDRFANGAALIESLESPAPIVTWTTARKPVFAAVAFLLAALVWYGYGKFSSPPPLRPDVARWYQEGVTALGDGSPTKAAKLFEQALSADTNFTAARCRLAEAYQELDMRDRAQEEMLAAVNGKVRLRAERAFCDGVQALLTGKWDEAIATFARREKATTAYIDKARWLERAARFKEAAQEYEQIVAGDGAQPGALLRLGVIRGQEGKNDEALKFFDQAARGFQALGNIEGLGETAYRRAIVVAGNSVDNSAKLIDEAVRRASESGNALLHSRALRWRSELAQRRGEQQLARDAALEAVRVAEQAGLGGEAANAFIDLGYIPFAQSDYVKAESEYNDALRLARRYRAHRAEARAMLSLSQLYARTNRVAEAYPALDAAIAYYSATGERRLLIQSYRLQGDALQSEGRLDEAMKAFQSAQSSSVTPEDQNQARLRLGSIASEQGNYSTAAEHYRDSVLFFEKAGNKALAQDYRIQLAYCYRLLGKIELAETELSSIEKAGPASPRIATLLELARASQEFEKALTDASLERLERLLASSKKKNEVWATREAEFHLCLKRAESDTPAKAKPYCESAAARFSNERRRLTEIRIARALASMDSRAVAEQETRAAIDLAKQNNDRFNRWYGQLVLTEILYRAKDPAWPTARQHAAEAMATWRRESGDPAVDGALARIAASRRHKRVESLQ